ncbi:MAG TPA: molybdopterin-binding protein [Pseudolabrys sp.]|jgi:molybdopterin biosynthesis enzyme
MAAASDPIQTITRLTPLADVQATVDSGVKPVAPRTLDVAAAAGHALAADAVASARPSAALALQDGWALAAGDTLGAGGYAPVQLMHMPQRVEAGQPMPAGTDSVAPLDAVKVSAGGAEALATVNPGDGVLSAGGDSDPGVALRLAGERLRDTDLAAFAGAGLAHVSVREPRIRVVTLRASDIIVAAARLLARDIERRGGVAQLDAGGDLDVTLAAEGADAIVAIGGTGSGRNDASVRTLARAGRLAVHGIALTPGETAAFGFVGPRPVLLLPGRLDAALAVWLVVGRRVLDRLAAAKANEHEPAETLPLARKVASTVGLAEVVPVRRNGDKAEPLATKYLPLSALARSDGWILVPADSEGYSAGAPVAVRPWP